MNSEFKKRFYSLMDYGQSSKIELTEEEVEELNKNYPNKDYPADISVEATYNGATDARYYRYHKMSNEEINLWIQLRKCEIQQTIKKVALFFFWMTIINLILLLIIIMINTG